jgi:phosphoglycolate phosphatase
VVSEKYEIIDEVLRHWEVKGSSSIWMIGDRSYDVEAATRHGLTTIGVTWGFGSETELLECGADALARVPRDLLGPAWREEGE